MINRLFKKTQKFTLIIKGKYVHYFKITFLDNSTAVLDNNFNYVMGSKIKEAKWVIKNGVRGATR